MINGKYSLIRYSANSGAEIEVSDLFVETLRGTAGPAIIIDVSDVFYETATLKSRIAASIIETASINETVNASVSMVANIEVSDYMFSVLSGSAKASQNIYVSLNSSEDLNATVYLGVNIPAYLESDCALYGNCNPRKKLEDSGFFATDVLLGTVNAGISQDFVVTFNVSIPPGGELRIDSENYTVTLNGENVLYAQSGYWPILSRELAQMTIDSGTGGEMTGEIVFAERWL